VDKLLPPFKTDEAGDLPPSLPNMEPGKRNMRPPSGRPPMDTLARITYIYRLSLPYFLLLQISFTCSIKFTVHFPPLQSYLFDLSRACLLLPKTTIPTPHISSINAFQPFLDMCNVRFCEKVSSPTPLPALLYQIPYENSILIYLLWLTRLPLVPLPMSYQSPRIPALKTPHPCPLRQSRTGSLRIASPTTSTTRRIHTPTIHMHLLKKQCKLIPLLWPLALRLSTLR
jgi:hypothetical protein